MEMSILKILLAKNLGRLVTQQTSASNVQWVVALKVAAHVDAWLC